MYIKLIFYEEVFRELNRAKVRYLVVGGGAVCLARRSEKEEEIWVGRRLRKNLFLDQVQNT